MGFVDERMPTQISQNFIPEIIWEDELTTNFGGYAASDKRWTSFLWRFSISYVRNQLEYDELFSFISSVCQGRGNSFRFKHPQNYTATDTFNVDLPACVRVSDKVYQLVREYRYGSQLLTKNVTRPVQNGVPDGRDTVQIYTRDGGQPPVLIAPGDPVYGWSVDESTGILTFDSNDPMDASLVTLSDYEYDIPVRLEDSNTPMRFQNKQVRTITGVILVEDRE